ncbi:hypothetical protein KY285_034387 [Solanum tuberosum]|nr:hypothetical protein KY289_032432 [Solanum tuberosum]KAH0649139.1 hypothetical protein KY285_034387 [Solanum tuberosum]
MWGRVCYIGMHLSQSTTDLVSISLHSTVLITSTSTASHFLILQVSTGHEKNAYLHNFCPLAPGVWVSGQ